MLLLFAKEIDHLSMFRNHTLQSWIYPKKRITVYLLFSDLVGTINLQLTIDNYRLAFGT